MEQMHFMSIDTRCPDTVLGNGIFIQYDVNIVIFTSRFICKSENVSMKNFKYVNI